LRDISYGSAEVDLRVGDASKAKRKLGWESKTKFKELVRLLVDSDLRLVEKKACMKDEDKSSFDGQSDFEFKDPRSRPPSKG
jgi:hypothetical protein